MKKTGKGLLLLSAFLSFLLLTAPAASAAPTELLPFENLTQDIGRGFGDTWNRYAFSMAEFNNQVYVGTWNVQFDYPALFAALREGEIGGSGSINPLEGITFLSSDGAEIWRHDGGQNWTQVQKAENDDTGYRKMFEYGGYIYAGSANSTNGAEIIRSTTGDFGTWEPVPGWVPTPDNNSIRTFTSFGGKLWVGTENNNDGAELWSYDGSSWQLVEKFVDDSSVSELIVYDNKLCVGTWDFTDSFKFYTRTDDGIFNDRTPEFPGSDSLQNVGVMKLIEFKGDLYLGTVNYVDGFTLLRTTDPENISGWKVISTDGLGDRSNAYTWSMVTMGDYLLMGTFNDGLYGGIFDPLPIPLDGRAQILATTDGLTWDTLVDDGFGEPFTYGIRNMLVSDNQLFVGTASNFFVPDLDTYLYDELGIGWEDIQAYLYQLGAYAEGGDFYSQLEAYFASIFTDGRLNIGTQIWVSQQVPEPATLLLVGIGILGLAGYRRSKFRK